MLDIIKLVSSSYLRGNLDKNQWGIIANKLKKICWCIIVVALIQPTLFKLKHSQIAQIFSALTPCILMNSSCMMQLRLQTLLWKPISIYILLKHIHVLYCLQVAAQTKKCLYPNLNCPSRMLYTAMLNLLL